MEKPIVFISHITEEKELAIELKRIIEDAYLGLMQVFVSSDDDSISTGSKWLDNISNSLENCAIELILCSEASVKRPWINFEAGAGWVRNIPVIPLCHSGMKKSELPIPINMLQAVEITSIGDLNLLLPTLSKALGCKIPKVDFNDFIEFATEFEERYTTGEKLKGFFELLMSYEENFDFDILTQMLDAICDQNVFLERLDLGVIENEFITKIKKYITSNGLTDYFELETGSPGTYFMENMSINGCKTSIFLKDRSIIKKHKKTILCR